tara:strand:+ start:1133 stop:1321 length:189 start_codon:yes stop_codon:yes gene_type:complete
MKKVAYLLILLSIISFVIYNISDTYVDSNGLLVEPFYLVPIGYLFFFSAFVLFILEIKKDSK